MTTTVPLSLYARLVMCSVLVFVGALPAAAQYRPRPVSNPATGETYHIEASAAFWFPTAEMSVSSGGSGALNGIPGTVLDFKNDLGLTDQRFPILRLELRPARSHKFRFEYIPIQYSQGPVVVKRDIIFNGQRYPVSAPISSVLDWKAYRLGYEFDFVTVDRGFAGVILEAKYTDVNATLTSTAPVLAEFARARAPIPAIGGTGRFYVVPNISITGEVTGFKLPDKVVDHDTGHYIDFDFYGTLNFTDNIGIQGGYRSLDVGFAIKSDVQSQCPVSTSTNTAGCFTLRGPYIGAVLRY